METRPSLILVVCFVALGGALYSLGPDRVVAAALRADPVWLVLSALPVAGRFVLWGHKWKRMLARCAPVPYRLCVRLVLAGSFANLTTPTAKLAGGVVRAAFLHRRRGWNLATAYGWSMADQVTNVLGHLLLFGLVAPTAALTLPAGPLRSALLVSGLAVLVGLLSGTALRSFAWRMLRRPAVLQRLWRWTPRRLRSEDESEDSEAGVLERVLEPLLHQGSAFGTFLPDLVWAAVAFSMFCLANSMALLALGVDRPFIIGTIAAVLGYFAGVVVGVPGGIGVTEAALAALYVQFGIPAETATAAALLHRAVFYLVVLGWGGAALIVETRTPLDAAD